MNTFQLPDETHVSRVHLRTADLARELDFYQRVIGLQMVSRNASEAALSATGQAPELLAFTEDQSATARRERTTGLYHVAIRFPSRRDLAHAVQRLAAAEYPIEGASDHGVSEAIYLSDPDGNGVELYVDRPRAEWPLHNGQLAMVTEALDFDSLLATAPGASIPTQAPAGTDIGHIHLHVADLAEAERFFHQFLGLELTQRLGNSAMFFAAGSYHHHIGANIWAGKTPSLPNAIGLVSYRLEVPSSEVLFSLKNRAQSFGYETRTADDIENLLQIRDPNGNWLGLEAAAPRVHQSHVHLSSTETELP